MELFASDTDQTPQPLDRATRLRCIVLMPGITKRQIRAARALLGWSQQDLADKAVISRTSLQRLERGGTVKSDAYLKVWRTLEQAGVEFIPAIGGRSEGVRLIR